MPVPAVRLAVLPALGLAVAAAAQSGLPAGSDALPGLDRAHLLQNKSVQDELKITPEQLTQLRRILRDSEQERPTREALSKAVSAVLRPEQLERLGQIEHQLRGVWGLLRTDIQKQLGLTDKQKKEIHAILEDLEKGVREVARQAAMDAKRRAEAPKTIHALNRDCTEKALEHLSEEQRKTWKEMAGEPFELKVELPRLPK
jgi:Spy/CpxP family protein refolding chaperone